MHELMIHLYENSMMLQMMLFETLAWTALTFWICRNYIYKLGFSLALLDDRLLLKEFGLFIFSCGFGHFLMWVFMVFLHHDAWMFRVVIACDLVTAISTQRVASRINWLLRHTEAEADLIQSVAALGKEVDDLRKENEKLKLQLGG